MFRKDEHLLWVSPTGEFISMFPSRNNEHWDGAGNVWRKNG